MPGETVEIKNGVVYVHKTDGTTIKMQEPYIKEPFYSNYNTLVIPANEYFVMGTTVITQRFARRVVCFP